jgi:hypothetical protein
MKGHFPLDRASPEQAPRQFPCEGFERGRDFDVAVSEPDRSRPTAPHGDRRGIPPGYYAHRNARSTPV